MPTLIPPSLSRKIARRSLSAARRPTAAKKTHPKTRRGAPVPILELAPPSEGGAGGEQVPAPPSAVGAQPDEAVTFEALVMALLAFIKAHQDRARDPASKALIQALVWVLRTAHLYQQEPSMFTICHFGKEATVKDGACGGLQVSLANPPPESITSKEPATTQQAPTHGPTNLEPTHRKMLAVADSLLGYVSDIGEAFADVRLAVDDLSNRDSPFTKRGRAEHLRDSLTKLAHLLRYQELEVVEFGEKLTGRPARLGRAAMQSRIDAVWQAARNCDPKFLAREQAMALSDARKAFGSNT